MVGRGWSVFWLVGWFFGAAGPVCIACMKCLGRSRRGRETRHLPPL